MDEQVQELFERKKIERDGFKNNFVFQDEILGYLFFFFVLISLYKK